MSSLKGFGFVDGTKDDFDYNDLERDTLYFVRTSSDKEYGLIYYNGKKYGNPTINAGEYPDNTKPKLGGTRSTIKSGTRTTMAAKPVVSMNYVKFTTKVDNSTIGLLYVSNGHTLEFSVDDGESWNRFDAGMSILIKKSGNSLCVRGILTSDNFGGQYHSDFHEEDDNYTQFEMSGDIKVSGNINALWNYEDIDAPLKAYCGFKLFNYCTAISDISEITLPSKELSEHCYDMMFQGCTSLVSVPSSLLPSLEMKESCYASMFYGCVNLINPPELRATTLAKECYSSMFSYCENLATAPELPATILNQSAVGCYNNMFTGCDNLSSIKCLVEEKDASMYTLKWVKGVAPSGTFIKSAASNVFSSGDSGIPKGWTVVEAK